MYIQLQFGVRVRLFKPFVLDLDINPVSGVFPEQKALSKRSGNEKGLKFESVLLLILSPTRSQAHTRIKCPLIRDQWMPLQ